MISEVPWWLVPVMMPLVTALISTLTGAASKRRYREYDGPTVSMPNADLFAGAREAGAREARALFQSPSAATHRADAERGCCDQGRLLIDAPCPWHPDGVVAGRGKPCVVQGCSTPADAYGLCPAHGGDSTRG